MANIGQGCAILSDTEDEVLKHNLCKMAYAEATYIAFHDYTLADLVFEISKSLLKIIVIRIIICCTWLFY